MSEDLARDTPGLSAGDLIVSVRHINLIAAIDGKSKKVKWAVIGQTVAQHSPRLLPDGTIIALDNIGGAVETGGSRIAELTYGSHGSRTVFPGPGAANEVNFWTLNAGHLDPHPDGGRALVSLTEQGRVLEIDLRRGRVLWQLVNTHDLRSYADRAGLEEDERVGRFATMGAYYIGHPPFLRSNSASR